MKTPPASDEFELSLFGPGYGECALLHLGDGSWAIVDSCIDERRGRQPALRYLEELGVTPESSVELVVLTHWHADHARGMAEVVQACVGAKVAVSQAFTTHELLVAAHRAGENILGRRDAFRELRDVMDILLTRVEGRYGVPEFTFAGAGKQLLPIGSSAQMTALAPSDASVYAAMTELAAELQDPVASTRSLPAPRPNHAAIVLWATVGDVHVLLGSDLEETSDPSTGWSAALAARDPSAAKAQVFKIPHHGSVTGHSDQVWSDLLDDDPIAVLTPFRSGRTRLPQSSDVTRLAALSDRLFITADPNYRKPARKPQRLQKAISPFVRAQWEANGAAGRVTIRSDRQASSFSVELEPPARQLN